MADLSDVENALVTLIAKTVFGVSNYQPGAYQATTTGVTTTLFRGWPVQSALNADLNAGKAHISVFPDPGMTRNVTRWMLDTNQAGTIAPTITATVAGRTVTLGGTVTADNAVGIQAGAPVAAYGYAATGGDTLTTIAATLAGKIAGATSSGPVITLPVVPGIAASVGCPQPALTVTRQQEHGLRVTVWAPTPAARDGLAALVDSATANITNSNGRLTRFLPVGTYETALIRYRASYTSDMPARDGVWRRDLCYIIEYPTSLIESDPTMLFNGGTITIGSPPIGSRQMGATAPS